MPSINVVKANLSDTFYHCYNRGVEKRDIFMEDQDYRVFLSLLKSILSPIPDLQHPIATVTGLNLVRLRPFSSIHEHIQLVCYCLMPNHFHLLVKQLLPNGMKMLIQKLCTSYSMYFNKKYHRVGHLFQGIYKASYVKTDEYLLHLSRYIHLNPVDTKSDFDTYPYSSCKYFLSGNRPEWLHPNHILQHFTPPINTYYKFITSSENSQEILGKHAID